MNLKKLVPSVPDVVASIVLLIIAVPLSMGIAMASGTSAASGLIAAAIGGIIVGALSGAPLAVSGPAAGLTVLVFGIVQEHGLIGMAVAAAVCGLVQLALGLARVGWIFSLVPAGVLNGMLAAIGAVIALGQIHVMMGADVPSSPFASIAQMGHSLSDALGTESGIIAPVFFCGLLALGIQWAWSRYLGRVKWCPPALAAVVIVTPISLLWPMARVNVESFGSVMGETFTTVMSFAWMSTALPIFLSGVALALVASAESLLTARAVDLLKKDNKPANLDRELIAQGTGNFFSGILGGLPITAVIVRSSANINAGAKTRWSTVLHGSWVLVFVLLLAGVLQKIPLTVLASVLVFTGVKLLNLGGLLRALRETPAQGMGWAVTMVAILATDLLVGLGIGLAFAVGQVMLERFKAGEPVFVRKGSNSSSSS